MAKGHKFLTKSRFKIGHECPTKLFYHDNKSYFNSNLDDSFLKALADGGFQVGALAKLYFPEGIEVAESDHEKALLATEELLKRDNVTIFEAAFRFKNLFARVDILKKSGDSIQLIEVKAKSYDSLDESDSFFLKKGGLRSKWEPYLVDVAFQGHIIKQAFPKFSVTCNLLLADKSKIATVDGLNQLFLLDKSKGKSVVVVSKSGADPKALGEKILTIVNIDHEAKYIWENTYLGSYTFSEYVEYLSTLVKSEIKAKPATNVQCKSCEFRPNTLEDLGNLKNGFAECWSELVPDPKLLNQKTFVFDIWNFRKAKKLIEENIFLINDLTLEDVSPKPNSDYSGFSDSERQWIQVEKIQAMDETPFLNKIDLAREIQSWSFPLHFIDFETIRPAIPFFKGMRPYEQIAFQFSHHQVERNGTVAHSDQFICLEPGKFPNFDFVRGLKAALERDSGTIFRFHRHENNVLCDIKLQLEATETSIPDKEELIKFIMGITQGPEDSWVGPRNMVDLWEVVKRFNYLPRTGGSISLKHVLPAVLEDSKYLQEKYSDPIYGTNSGPTSLNFQNHQWVKIHGKSVMSPYHLLPDVLDKYDFETLDRFLGENSIADGGAAMMAYAMAQFTEMSDIERQKIKTALLKYCELDTFAMVLIYEYWISELSLKKKTA